jgi:hypothetical protein
MSLLAASTNYWARLNLVKVSGVHLTVGLYREYGTHGVALGNCSRNGKFKLKQWAANQSLEGSVTGGWFRARFRAAPQLYR